MKKFNIFIVLVVLVVMVLTACTNQNAVETEDLITTNPASSLVGNTEKSTVSESSTAAEESITEKIESTSQKSTEPSTTEKATTTAKSTTTTTKQSTTAKPTTTKASAITTTTKKVTTTQKQTTTQKPSTTKKETTTKKQTTTTTKKSGLSKSDVEWVQSQANSYIKSLGCNLNSDVRSFSGRIASKAYKDRNALLSVVKDAIYTDYQECKDSGWNTVDMYCKIEPTSDGNYYIYVMFG